MKGVAMELQDCAFPLVDGVYCTDDPDRCFEDIDIALLVGSKPRGKKETTFFQKCAPHFLRDHCKEFSKDRNHQRDL